MSDAGSFIPSPRTRKVAAASSQEESKTDPDVERLEKIPAHSLSLIRPSDLAGVLLLEDQW